MHFAQCFPDVELLMWGGGTNHRYRANHVVIAVLLLLFAITHMQIF